MVGDLIEAIDSALWYAERGRVFLSIEDGYVVLREDMPVFAVQFEVTVDTDPFELLKQIMLFTSVSSN